jgi:hypothetical protein
MSITHGLRKKLKRGSRAPLLMWPARPRSLGELNASPSRRLGLLEALAAKSGDYPYTPMLGSLLVIGALTAGVMGFAIAWEVGVL